MPDVNLDSQFNWGAIRTGFEEMRAFGQQTARSITRDIGGMFAGTIAVTGVVHAFESIIQQAVDLHREAARFSIDAEQLQTIGNAAKEIGLPLDLVARAMNLVEINAYKASQGSAAQADALERLGINAQEFFALRQDEKMLALADAYKAASDKGNAYEAIATIIGKRNTELIPLLQQGAQAIREQGDAMAKFSDTSVERLARLHEQMERFQKQLQVTLGTWLTNFVAAWQTGWYAITSIFIAAVDTIVGGFHVLERAMHLDFSGAVTEWKNWANVALEQLKSVHDYEQEAFGKEPHKPPGPPTEAEPGGVGAGGGGAGGGGGGGTEDQIRLEQQLAKLRRDAAFEQLSDQGKLEALERELYALHLKALDFSVSQEEHTKALIAEEQKRKELTEQQNKMADDAAKYAEKEAQLRQDMADAADKDLADAKEKTKELQFELAGRKDLAERARIEYDFDNKIKDAKKAIADAEAHGFTEVANTNRALVTQLSLEKNTALAAHDKAAAEERAAEAAKEKAKVDSERNTLEQLKQENVLLDLKIAGQTEAAQLTQIEFEFRNKINDTLAQANDLWTQMAQAYAEGNKELGDQLAIEAQIKQEEADQLDIERQKTEQLQMQENSLKDQQATRSSAGGAGTPESFYGPHPLTIAALAEGNLRLGATSDVYAAALAASRGIQPGTPAYERLVQQIAAEDQLRMLQGRNLSFFDQLNRDRLVQWYANMQQQHATQQANISHQQEIQYWQAIASGMPAPGGNPFTYFFGTSPYTSANMIPTAGPNQIATLLQNSGFTQTQILQVLQQIATNTAVVRV